MNIDIGHMSKRINSTKRTFIIDFNNIFYKDTILFKDIKEIKMILSVLKEYKLSLNNYIFVIEYFLMYERINH